MKKRLAILAIAAFVTVVPLTAQPNQTANQKQQSAPQGPPSPVAPPPEKHDSGDQDKGKASTDPPKWYTSFENPDGMLVIVGVLTFFVIGWQSIQTRKAAQGALLNAQALINAERPWIMVTVEEVVGPMGGFQLYITNKGRTPAMVTGAYMGCVVVKSILTLPDKAPYPRGSMATDRIILPDEKLSLTWFGGGALKKLVGETFPITPPDGDIFVFGKIIYKDLLDPFPTKPHETRWIGLYQLPVGESSDSIFSFQGIGAPEEYDHYS